MVAGFSIGRIFLIGYIWGIAIQSLFMHNLKFALIYILLALHLPVNADNLNLGTLELGDPHYTLYRTWALSPPDSENPFKITSFLPEGYLFHILDKNHEVVSNSRYSLVLTQDGVKVLLYSGAISDLTFRQTVGDHELIFNSRYQLCKTIHCTSLNENANRNTWAIARSEAFKIVEETNSNQQSLIKIKATRGWEIIEGYLSQIELDELVAKGIVTRTDQLLPKYLIKKTKSSALSTSCGEERSASDVIEISESDHVANRLIDLLQMGVEVPEEKGMKESVQKQIDKKRIELTKDYGTKDYLYAFYLYEIEDRTVAENSDQRFFQAASGLKISCTDNKTLGTPTKDYIDHAIFVNSRNQFNGEPFIVDISSRLFNTPRDIRQYTSDAYMISINKPEHFEQSIKILSDKIGDRTLAGYMLTELNRSCRSELRVQYSGSVCRIYDY